MHRIVVIFMMFVLV